MKPTNHVLKSSRLITLLLAGLALSTPASAVDYTFTDLGSQFWQPYVSYANSGFGYSTATHINNNGQVLLQVQQPEQSSVQHLDGTYSYSYAGRQQMAYKLDNGQYTPIDTFRSYFQREQSLGIYSYSYYPGTSTTASGFNNNGNYVGTVSSQVFNSYSDGTHQYGWQPVVTPAGGYVSNLYSYAPTCINPCNGSTANGLNDAGQVVGSYNVYNGAKTGQNYDTRAYVSLPPAGTNPGSAFFLSDLSLATSSTAMAINNQGIVVGSGFGGVVGGNHALLWKRDNPALPAYRTYDLGMLVAPDSPLWQGLFPNGGAPTSVATAVNNAGMVIGNSTAIDTYVTNGQTSYAPSQHAFVWKDGVMQDLGNNVQLNAINNNGIVVGTGVVNGTNTAFMWKNGVGLLDLNTMVDHTGGYTLVSANGINDQGEIVGQASMNGVFTAFKLNPLGLGMSAMNPILQTGLSGSTFNFTSGNNFIQLANNAPARPGGFYDPMVAVGYIFEMDATDTANAFTAAQVPYQYGDGIFSLELFDETTGNFVSTGAPLTAGSWFDFGGSGVRKFRITGIETSAYVDPTDQNAFVTGLTFLGANAKFKMTAMETSVDGANPLNALVAASTSTVPVPAAAWLLGSGMLGLIGVARRKALSR